jgi:hypothetical protein
MPRTATRSRQRMPMVIDSDTIKYMRKASEKIWIVF